MTPDQVMALSLSVGLCFSLVNTRALLVDGRANGVRPYLAGWVAVSNCILGAQLLGLGQWLSGTMFVLCGVSSAVNSALIAFYQYRKSN